MPEIVMHIISGILFLAAFNPFTPPAQKKSVKLRENGASETSSPPRIPRQKLIYRHCKAIKIHTHSCKRVFN
jgi:hypothetical protein